MKRALYPLFLDLEDKPVLVVGAGSVGAQKALGLVRAGAQVRVVAPRAVAEVTAAAAAGTLRWDARAFQQTDVDGVYLIIAATGDPAVNAEVALHGAAARVFVNGVDDPAHATAYAAAVLERGPVTVAFSTGGRAPAVCRLVRDLVAAVLPPPDQALDWVEQAQELRRRWRQEGVPIGARYAELLQALLRTAAASAGGPS